MRSRWWCGFAAILLVPALLAAAPVAASGATTHAAALTQVTASPTYGPELPVGSVYQTVASPAGDRVYVATGTDEVIVADRAGRAVGQIGDLAYNHGVAVAPDGTLWVALPDSREVVAVDPATLRVRTRYPVPHDSCPGDVAVTGRFVVFGFSCFFFATTDPNPSNSAGIGALDTATGQVSVIEPYLPGVRPIVATSPALPGKVYAVDYNSHSTALALLDVSTGTPQWVTSHYLLNESVFDLAVSPDGRTVAIATYFDDIESFSAADLTPATTYPLDCNGLSLAWSPDSSRLAVGCNHHTDVYHVAVFVRGSTTPEATVPLYGQPDRVPVARGLTLAPDMSAVLVATRAWFEYRCFLEPMGLRPSAVTVTGPDTATVTRPVTLYATLTGDGAPAAAGIPLDVARCRHPAGHRLHRGRWRGRVHGHAAGGWHRAVLGAARRAPGVPAGVRFPPGAGHQAADRPVHLLRGGQAAARRAVRHHRGHARAHRGRTAGHGHRHHVHGYPDADGPGGSGDRPAPGVLRDRSDHAGRQLRG
jgi:streptogramin lyase